MDEHLYIVYSDNSDPTITRGGFRVHFAELDFDGSCFAIDYPECLHHFEGENKDRREKNWVPFEYNSSLLLAYSLTPHLILYPIYGTGSCKTVATTMGSIQWEWGEPRGGTPGILVGNEYLAFFHSSKELATTHSEGKNILHYFMGAYTFSCEPPFAITKISPEPIVGKNFYKGAIYKPYWKPVRVVFPCGFLCDDKYIWVAYGRQDHEVWIAKLDKKGLFDSLLPVANHMKNG